MARFYSSISTTSNVRTFITEMFLLISEKWQVVSLSIKNRFFQCTWVKLTNMFTVFSQQEHCAKSYCCNFVTFHISIDCIKLFFLRNSIMDVQFWKSLLIIENALLISLLMDDKSCCNISTLQYYYSQRCTTADRHTDEEGMVTTLVVHTFTEWFILYCISLCITSRTFLLFTVSLHINVGYGLNIIQLNRG